MLYNIVKKERNSNENYIYIKIRFIEVDLYNYWKMSVCKICCDEYKEYSVIE